MGAVRLLRHHEGPRSPVHAGAGVALVVGVGPPGCDVRLHAEMPKPASGLLRGLGAAWARGFFKTGLSRRTVWCPGLELEVGLQVWAVSGVKFTSCEVSGVLWASRRCKPSRLRFNTNIPRECNNHQEGVCWVQVCSGPFRTFRPLEV